MDNSKLNQTNMRVNYANGTFHVHFLFSGPRLVAQDIDAVRPHHTVCLIEDEEGGLLMMGKATKSPKDDVNIEEGEKHALQQALQKLKESGTAPEVVRTVEFRKAVWDKYRVTGGGKPKW